jgi:hypothetical protein
MPSADAKADVAEVLPPKRCFSFRSISDLERFELAVE